MDLPAPDRRIALLLAVILFGAALLQGLSYWPGIMTWDAINQYGQATEGVFDDWHPPAMAWLWRQLIAIRPGPAPMFAIQIGLYWLGYALIVGGALRRGLRTTAALIALVALMPFPLAIMGSVLKDCLMQGLMLCVVGIFVWSGPERGWGARIVAILCLMAAGLLRFNAFLATLPLLVAILPPAWRDRPVRLGIVIVAGLAALLMAMPLANRAIGADHSDVELSLMIFDLGGIGKQSGVNLFPDIGVADPVAVNARCYSPEKWDPYSTWASPLCPIGFTKIDAWMTEHHAHAYPTIAKAALRHPIAYAAHRLAHFNINSRFLVADEVQGAAPDKAVDNEWGFVVPSNPGLRLINRLTMWSAHTPLCWPIVWIALAGGLLALCPLLPSRGIIAPIALSALAYGLGYLPFSVSSELRYNLWTITATAIAGAFVIGDVRGGATVPRRRWVASLAPTVIVALLCAMWRLS